MGSIAVLPGLFLLNQELGLIPLGTQVYEIEFDGETLSIQQAMFQSFSMGGPVLAIGFLLGMIAWRNARLNRRNE